jgi:hypothetical protein
MEKLQTSDITYCTVHRSLYAQSHLSESVTQTKILRIFSPLAAGEWRLLFRKLTTSAIDIKIQSAIEIDIF